ncbi:ABC transporter transmembrane domain-containing protein [Shewanella surugensis]|uniref:ATP-binding cassette domain-containing protein n=1 Tax=Shewanella surugensis TaxID=212020 RepID=A0ABT0L975_9GAMM|nr:ABC transporter transmembrane domain-containing protein [Shewanella surugensis]MCL1124263.1 ATP-binding cassette domain-containing protein [Shewanella surugensis]
MRSEKFTRNISTADKFYLFVSTIITTFLGLALPFSILIIFDRILPNQSKDSLFLLSFIIIIAIYFDYYLKNKEEMITSLVMKYFDSDLTNKIFKDICYSDIHKYKKYSPGEYLERISIIPELKSFFGGESVKAVINTLTCIITILIIGVINIGSGTLLLISSLILIISAITISTKKVKVLEKRSDIEGRTNSKIIEIVSSPLDIKSRTMEYRIESLMNVMINEREDQSIAFEKLDSMLGLILSFIQQLSIAAVVVILALSVIAQEISQGVMAAVILLTNRYFSPYQQVIRTLSRWKVNKLNIARISALFYLTNEKSINIKEFSVNNVLLSLNNDKILSLTKGNLYILHGSADSGKSYLTQCLTMEIIDSDIKITIDDKLLSSLDYNTWKDKSIKIDNKSALIEGSIIDNLTCFRHHLNDAAFALCENLLIKSEIDALKNGFYTLISGNQQHPFSRKVNYSLLIIRALLSNKSIIILDDIDTIHDMVFEKMLSSTILSKKSNLIFIIISNKFSYRDPSTQYIHIIKGY